MNVMYSCSIYISTASVMIYLQQWPAIVFVKLRQQCDLPFDQKRYKIILTCLLCVPFAVATVYALWTNTN